MKAKIKGVCKLCGNEKILVEAHIIPESFYKFLYNEKRIFFEANTSGSDTIKLRRKGVYDRNILCYDCDNGILNRMYDDYIAKVFWNHSSFKGRIKYYHSLEDIRVKWRVATGVKSKTIKLFFLSLLWRAHVSSNPFFDSVDLGVNHSERIRKMILENNAGKSTDYPIILLDYSVTSPEARVLISKISRFKKDGRTYYAGAISGILVIWHFSDYLLPKSLKHFIIGEQEDKIFILQSLTQGYDFLNHFLGR